MEQQKEFTGVWIPRHILEDVRLKPVDRLIYAEIACFAECWHTNTVLAERSGSNERSVTRSISRLMEIGYIELVSFNGRNRVVKVCFDKPTSQTDVSASPKRAVRVDKMSRQTRQNDPLDNKKITIRKQEVTTAKADDEVSKIYFQVAKQYGLPVRNYNNVRSAIAKMKAECTRQECLTYLFFLKDKYQALDFDYKPELVEALDIHAKRLQIITAVKRTAKANQKGKALVL